MSHGHHTSLKLLVASWSAGLGLIKQHLFGLLVLSSWVVEMPSLESVAPYLQQLSFGALAGFVAGYALKKVGRMVALILGLLFVVLQILAYYGLVTINWIEVQERVNPFLESESLNRTWQGLLNIMLYNVTFAAAFIPGFIWGIRKG